MPPSRPRPARILALVAAAAFVAAVYAWGILSNFCVDSDTLNWASSLAPLRERMTFLNCIAIKGWFTKFHLLMFSAVYAVAGLCALWGPWDFLLAFKLFTLVCAVATVPLLFSICRDTMKIFPVMLVTSLIPLFTIGYSWLIITADDNPLANFFNLLFVYAVLVASGAARGWARERSPMGWALAAGAAAGLSMAAHLKNIVALPLLAAPAVFTPPPRAGRARIAAAALAGFLAVFGLLYGLYWIQSPGEPAASKLDFWVFHRVPGRFFLTPPHPPILDHLAFVYAGIRSSLYSFQELKIHTGLYDRDPLGPVLILLFFCLYAAAVLRGRANRAVQILFAWFLLDAGHSFLYDSWVVERWDSFTLPVFLSIGICWDSALAAGGARRAKILFSALLALFFAALVWTNARSAYLLIGITGNRIPCRVEEKKWWAQRLKFYFYFDHRGLYRMARAVDGIADGKTWFLSPRVMRPADSTPHFVLERYLSLYSRCYAERRLDDPNGIEALVAGGRLDRLLYVDRLRVPFYVPDGRAAVIFDPSGTKTVYENPQVVLREASFISPARPR